MYRLAKMKTKRNQIWMLNDEFSSTIKARLNGKWRGFDGPRTNFNFSEARRG